MVSLPAEFRAQLESYSGPLDLLLYLIKKEEVDVFDIPIAHVIAQYQTFLEILKEIDPNVCGEFLVMAARLMEIKSKLLLPREALEDEEDLEDPRIELVRQLLEYKKYKERAMLLEKRLDLHRRRHHRPPLRLPVDEQAFDSPLPLGDVSVWDLFTAFHRIQIMLGQREPIQVVFEERPLEAYFHEIREILEQSPGRSRLFDELFSHARNRQEAIAYFLALLELAKQYLVTLAQEEQFGPITIQLRAEEEARRLQHEAGVLAETDPTEAFLLEGEGADAAVEELESTAETDENSAAPTEDDISDHDVSDHDVSDHDVSDHDVSDHDAGTASGTEKDPPVSPDGPAGGRP